MNWGWRSGRTARRSTRENSGVQSAGRAARGHAPWMVRTRTGSARVGLQRHVPVDDAHERFGARNAAELDAMGGRLVPVIPPVGEDVHAVDRDAVSKHA